MPYNADMVQRSDLPAGCRAVDKRPKCVPAAMGVLGVAIVGLALAAVQPFQFNVVTYATEPFGQPLYWPSLIFVLLIVVAIIGMSGWAAWSQATNGRFQTATSLLWPLVLSAPLAVFLFLSAPPPFVFGLVTILALGWAAFRAAAHVAQWPSHPSAHGMAVSSIALLIVLLTAVHTLLQINYHEHFMLGHADFGHFTEELKNALAGRGLRSDSFENTRFGWHFTPLLYVLVPGYALWPSPIYLMVCGALIVHIAALPVYYFARRVSGSVAIAWMFAVAWLLLPTQSRLVYTNTYGFQWPICMMPLLALLIAAGVTKRWRMSLVMVVLVLLCKETAAAATLGWGLYVALFTSRRKMGLVIAAASVAYFVLCTKVVIPYFALAGRYERFDLFGELGGGLSDLVKAVFAQPGVFWGRMVRREVLYFLLILIVPMALLPLRGRRVALAALPTLVLILLLQNEEWLSIKFWHHCTALPFLFLAGVASMHPAVPNGSKPGRLAAWLSGVRSPSCRAVNFGVAFAALVCAAMGHYFYGFSPVGKVYGVYAAATPLHEPDPRMETVRRLRTEISTDNTILATERLAAHFTDYKRLYTGRRIRPVDFVLIDRSDTWDTSGLPEKASVFASNPDYTLYGEFGSIVAFARLPDAPPVPFD